MTKLFSFMENSFLTEKNLGTMLNVIMPEGEWIYKQLIPQASQKVKPTYRNEHYKLCIEYDDPKHYIDPALIRSEAFHKVVYEQAGYQVVRVPYFIQLDTEMLKHLFDVDIECDYGFPHGFVTVNSITPAYYCTMGIFKYNDQITSYPEHVRDAINYSVYAQIKLREDQDLVLPFRTKVSDLKRAIIQISKSYTVSDMKNTKVPEKFYTFLAGDQISTYNLY